MGDIFTQTNELISKEETRRSTLYSIKPIGVGTPFVESLTSYIGRLSESHCVLPSKLVKEVISLELKIDYVYNNIIKDNNFEDINYVNSCSYIALDFTSALERLTLRTDIIYLTLLHWKGLDVKGVLLHYKQWCPSCLSKWKSEINLYYEPLIWFIRHIDYCPFHNVYLVNECPNCKRKIPVFKNVFRIGYCSYCNYQLDKAGALVIEDKEDIKWKKSVFNSISELIINYDLLANIDFKTRIRELINEILLETTNGNITHLAEYLNINTGTIWDWKEGNHTPSIDNILKLSYILDLSIISLLKGEKIKRNRINTVGLKQFKNKKKGKFDYFKIRSVLENSINQYPPLSFSEICRSFGHNPSNVRRRFPSLAKKISNRYMEYQRDIRYLKEKVLCEEIKEVSESLLKEGVFPSWNKIRENVTYSSFYLTSAIDEARDEILTKYASLRVLVKK